MVREATDRSRIITAQRCRRARWYEYHEQGTGIQSARKALPLAVGGAVHEGLAVLLREGQAARDKFGSLEAVPAALWDEMEERAVKAALADFEEYKNRLDVGAEKVEVPLQTAR